MLLGYKREKAVQGGHGQKCNTNPEMCVVLEPALAMIRFVVCPKFIILLHENDKPRENQVLDASSQLVVFEAQTNGTGKNLFTARACDLSSTV